MYQVVTADATAGRRKARQQAHDGKCPLHLPGNAFEVCAEVPAIATWCKAQINDCPLCNGAQATNEARALLRTVVQSPSTGAGLPARTRVEL